MQGLGNWICLDNNFKWRLEQWNRLTGRYMRMIQQNRHIHVDILINIVILSFMCIHRMCGYVSEIRYANWKHLEKHNQLTGKFHLITLKPNYIFIYDENHRKTLNNNKGAISFKNSMKWSMFCYGLEMQFMIANSLHLKIKLDKNHLIKKNWK